MNRRPPVLVTRPLAPEVLEFLRAHCAVDAPDEDRPMPREELLRRIRGKHGVLAMLTDLIDDETLEAAGPQLRVVANHAVGYDNVDVAACSRRGVVVTNTPDVLTGATADLAWALVLAAARRIVEGDRLIRSGRPWEWSPTFMLGREVSGKTLGIVGLGRIGTAVAKRAAGFSMRILYTARARKPEAEEALGAEFRPFSDLLREADVVTIHVPLDWATTHLVGDEELRAMKAEAILVNTSRGPVVDEAALARALASGEIAAAGLDVYEREPEVHPDLLEVENAVLVPHLGSATVETRAAMGMLAARNLVAALSGEKPPTPVDLNAGPSPPRG